MNPNRETQSAVTDLSEVIREQVLPLVRQQSLRNMDLTFENMGLKRDLEFEKFYANAKLVAGLLIGFLIGLVAAYWL